MDVDISTLVKNHDENKTFILVKLSESFSNAIQEYSAAQQQQQQHHKHPSSFKSSFTTNNSSTSSSSLTSYPPQHQQNQHKQPPKHTLSSSKTFNNKRPKLQHSVNDNTSTLSNYSNINNYNNSHHNNNNNNNANTNNNINSNVAPTIRFRQDGARGTIKFPNGKCYDFSLEQSDNSVECIKQTKKKWETVGKMACCLHVKGKDDVYQRTRTKMEAAEQEKRKYCTKLLDNNSNSNNSNSNSNNNNSNNININNNNNSNNNHNNNINNNNTNTNTNSNTNNNIINNSSNNNNNNHAYLSKYPDITDVKQLKKYKADFDKDYEEYQTLHGYLHKIEDRFKELRELLEQRVVGSPDWESAKERIFDEYERVKSDSNFHRARSKYKQLYNKLAHIKKKIFQFRRQQKDKLSTNNTSSRPRQHHNNRKP